MIYAMQRPGGLQSAKVVGDHPTKPTQTTSVAPLVSRRHLGMSLAAGALLATLPRPASATGLESIPLDVPPTPQIVEEMQRRNRATLDAAEDSFQQSDLLRELKARSEANKEQREKELREKYCLRQAEDGVGDCAGLRLIPGATKSGVQKRPEWLDKLVFGDSPPE